jgi:DNA-binding PadR family transcriptional regulator
MIDGVSDDVHNNLEEAILKILYDKSMTSTQLKQLSETRMGQSVSFKTYSKHIARLLDEGMIIIEHDKGRGSTKKYAISSIGSKRYKLGLNKSNPNYLIFKQVYINLLFRDMPFGTTFATSQLEKLLGDLEISKKQLKVHHIEENYLDQNLVGDLESPYLQRRLPVQLTIYYHSVSGAYILESIEYREHIYYRFCMEMDSVFQYTLPGMSINDFINKRYRFKATRRLVESLFVILHEIGIIGPIGQFRGETRYIIMDDEFHDLILDIHRLNDLGKELDSVWFRHFDKPSKEQLEKMKLFYADEKSANSYLMKLEIQRYLNRKEIVKRKGPHYFETYLKRGTSLLNQFTQQKIDFVKSLRKKHEKTIQRYEYLSDVIGSICPMLYS